MNIVDSSLRVEYFKIILTNLSIDTIKDNYNLYTPVISLYEV
jgi:hypothetical protein